MDQEHHQRPRPLGKAPITDPDRLPAHHVRAPEAGQAFKIRGHERVPQDDTHPGAVRRDRLLPMGEARGAGARARLWARRRGEGGRVRKRGDTAHNDGGGRALPIRPARGRQKYHQNDKNNRRPRQKGQRAHFPKAHPPVTSRLITSGQEAQHLRPLQLLPVHQRERAPGQPG